MLNKTKYFICWTVSVYYYAKGIIKTLPFCQFGIWVIYTALSEEYKEKLKWAQENNAPPQMVEDLKSIWASADSPDPDWNDIRQKLKAKQDEYCEILGIKKEEKQQQPQQQQQQQ